MTCRRAALLGLVLLLAPSGCAAQQAERGPVSTVSIQSLPDGTTLRQLGFSNGPTNLVLPNGVKLEAVVDQPNVVTLFFTPENGKSYGPWLSEHVEQMGFTIDTLANGQLLFHDDQWRGAFTTPLAGEKATLAGLTLRKQP